MPDFLLELGLEEVPARMIDAAEEELRRRLSDLLLRESLSDGAVTQTSRGGSAGATQSDTPIVETYTTPRRLAVLAREVRAAQSDLEEQVQGPATNARAIAVEKFAERVGLRVDKLQRINTAKGEYFTATIMRKGRSAAEILAEALPKEISALYWPKNMYWRVGKPERFVRPVRWIVALLGESVVPLQYAGITATKLSRGHRVLASPTQAKSGLGWGAHAEVEIREPGTYAGDLKEAGVFARREERYAMIRSALDKAVKGVGRWREDRELLNTVVNLTEFPSVVLGSFDREFLTLPEEVLVTVMRDHQKYFAIEDATGKLAPHFLAVLNIDADPQGTIRHGNERVLRARFNDARFFWDSDQKHPLRARVEWLKKVTFQKDLGSYFEKTMRVQRLASQISEALKDAGVPVRPGIVHKAALLAKTDLTAELVKEFTELQGIVGGLYAKAQGLDPAIGDAIYDQYKPESMEDAVPRTIEGAVLAIADKADSIAGMFALGMIPSGSKDPFALRRAANGIVKIIAEHKLAVAIDFLFADAREGYRGSEAEKKFVEGKVADATDFYCQISDFFRERVEFYLSDTLHFAYDVVNAVLAAGVGDIVDVMARAQAVAQVRESEDFEHISIAFKRIKNILRQARETGKRVAEACDPAALTEVAERALAQAMERTAPRVRELARAGNYAEALAKIATIRPAVDTFFDKVMVMVEDEGIRANRLALLHALLNEFSTIADFSEIVTEKK